MKKDSNGSVAFIAAVAVVVFLIGVVMMAMSPAKSNEDNLMQSADSRSEDRTSSSNHREDDFIGYSLDTLCQKRGTALGDDKIFMNDDPDDYSGAFLDCETYFETTKKYETLYVIKRETLNDTRMVRKSFDEYYEQNFDYYLYTVSDRSIANIRGVAIKE